MTMGRVPLWLTGLIPLLAAAACETGGSSPVTAPHPGQTYRDSAGWTIEIEPGWHAMRFTDAKDGIISAGVQLSDIKLPPPTLIPGYPIQVNGQVLPEHGVALIIATDTDPALAHGPAAVPPLPAPNGRYWTMGSAPAGPPYLETLWFRLNGMTFLACAKIGPNATRGDLQALAAIIRSLR
jgi:hypothetical protein